MPCHDPVPAWTKADGSGFYFKGWPKPNDAFVPCGGCLGCRLDQSRDWAVRSVHEAQLHEHSQFLTLTYDDEHLPASRSLVKRDFQLFMKKYRKEYGDLKYLMCGEYGEEKGRPHYHALIFGHNFLATDRQCRLDRKNKQGDPLFRSPDLQELWGQGFCLTGAVTFQSAAYVGRYVMKKVKGRDAKEHYKGRVPEYVQPSTGGRKGRGLSYGWITRYLADVYPSDFVVVDNRKYKPPRYYDKVLKEVNEEMFFEVKAERRRRAEERKDPNFWQRLEAAEKIKRQQFERLIRSIE